ncbi:MAG: type II toxin-antitoxin system HicA family toxin [Burkholderiales bacterium]
MPMCATLFAAISKRVTHLRLCAYTLSARKLSQYEVAERRLGARIGSSAKQVRLYNYRQTGSHIRLTTEDHREHHVTIPNHEPLRIETLAAILTEVAQHAELPREELTQRLFGH